MYTSWTQRRGLGSREASNYSFKGNQNRSDFAPLNSGVRPKMRNTVAFIISSFVFLLASGCARSTCTNSIVLTASSPSGQLNAFVFNRACGATTGFSTQVSVLSANSELPNGPGNLFIADDKFPVRVRWESETALRVTAPEGHHVFKREASIIGVAVHYSGQDKP